MLRYAGLGLLGLILFGVFTPLFAAILAIIEDKDSWYLAPLLGAGAAVHFVVKFNSLMATTVGRRGTRSNS
jgi:hypothetical protein